jgi:hypothetical protein
MTRSVDQCQTKFKNILIFDVSFTVIVYRMSILAKIRIRITYNTLNGDTL